jgi:hypothetical protein
MGQMAPSAGDAAAEANVQQRGLKLFKKIQKLNFKCKKLIFKYQNDFFKNILIFFSALTKPC